MRTVTTITHETAYSFRELIEANHAGDIPRAGEAVEKARQWLAEAATGDSFWYEYTIDQWKEALESIGFTAPKIWFSGFGNQGDGALFESGVDKEGLLAFLSCPVEPSGSITVMPADPKQEDFRGWIVHKCGGVRFDPAFRRLAKVADWLEVRNRRTWHGYGSNHCPSACKIDAELDWHNYEPRRLLALLETFTEAAEELRSDLCHAIYYSLRDEYEYRCSDEALIEDAEANGWLFTEDGEVIR